MLEKRASKDLRVGMFIAELDRPWMDTPFLLQGFLLEDEDQIAQLKGICAWVMIDPFRSVGPEFERSFKKKPPPARELGQPAIVNVNRVYVQTSEGSSSEAKPPKRAPLPSDTGTPPRAREPAAAAARVDAVVAAPMDFNVRTSSAATPAGLAIPIPKQPLNPSSGSTPSPPSGLWGQLKAGVAGLFVRKHRDKYNDSKAGDYEVPKDDERANFIPESIQITVYHDLVSVENEIGFATETYIRTGELLHKVVEDIRVGNDLQLDQVEGVIEDMVDSMVRNPDAMMWVAKMREQDLTIYTHGLNVAIALVAFGRHLGYPKDQLGHLGLLGLMLDVGKIKLPKELLDKRDRLSAPEFEMVKRHVDLSVEILYKTPNTHPDVVEGVAQHHERVDGSGYPSGMVGSKISVFGRMAAIADTYAAVTKARPYAETVSPHEALQMLSNWSGTQFQTDMVEQFIQSIGVFPVGSLVELSTGEVAAIATHNKLKRLRPKVLILTESDKSHHKFPVMRDLLYDSAENPTYIRRGLPANSYGLDPREFYLT